ncbi:hypothetical protein EJ05DRAFT_440491 [Pseudovirgaria hyperparasitica]|uniref:Low temperature requirement A n=1 Tax=Pseudovirgaria hyperparasitica TaxID=470096 RepID=A0A6A6W706_9PEZI|nr:uncharacterized protein EJ05DRAFT_440491 [Pseudovirgaria hyperparasitica]KAF2756861.1 hypothetical protein EJ05DRAFT_440491 [Pseudovirgaria hyperparasitica]
MLRWNGETEAFSPRHEASTIELFFDLFFVANLATFTDYHAITNWDNFGSYIAFFAILWVSWFQITTFDVRFAADSVWERGCKVVHCLYFISIMLVGYKAEPSFVDPKIPDWVHQTLCFAMLINRAWLGIQYLVTTIYSTRPGHHPKDVVLPLAIQSGLFFLTGGVYGALAGTFHDRKGDIAGFYSAIYLTLTIELMATLGISMRWRKLSFRATHLNERLGLLGIIIIGEGVIGLTKTIINTMGRTGPDYLYYALIFCNVLILLFMWQLYYDNLPRYRFGTIKQQLWAALHFPMHLAILGVAEGTRQIILAYFAVEHEDLVLGDVTNACNTEHLDGTALSERLSKTIKSLKLDSSCPGRESLPFIYDQIALLGNSTGVCSAANITNPDNVAPGLGGVPRAFVDYISRATGGVVQSLNIEYIPEAEASGLAQSMSARKVVYNYYWGAILLLLACLTASALLAKEGHRLARMRTVSVVVRSGVVMTVAMLLMLGNLWKEFLRQFNGSPWVLPTVVFMFWVVALGDRYSKGRLQKKREEQAAGAASS